MVATALDMRYRTHDLLASLARGVQVVITYRGKKTGILSPYRVAGAKQGGSVRAHPFFASSADDARSVDEELDMLRGGRFEDI